MLEGYLHAKAFFTSFALWAGVSVAAASLLDLLISKDQREKISDRIVLFWIWLEDRRDFRWLRDFQSRNSQRKSAGIIAVILLLVLIFVKRPLRLELFDVFVSAMGIVASAYILSNWRFGLQWITSTPNFLLYIFRTH